MARVIDLVPFFAENSIDVGWDCTMCSVKSNYVSHIYLQLNTLNIVEEQDDYLHNFVRVYEVSRWKYSDFHTGVNYMYYRCIRE